MPRHPSLDALAGPPPPLPRARAESEVSQIGLFLFSGHNLKSSSKSPVVLREVSECAATELLVPGAWRVAMEPAGGSASARGASVASVCSVFSSFAFVLRMKGSTTPEGKAGRSRPAACCPRVRCWLSTAPPLWGHQSDPTGGLRPLSPCLAQAGPGLSPARHLGHGLSFSEVDATAARSGDKLLVGDHPGFTYF